jgi:hypothetical protein
MNFKKAGRKLWFAVGLSLFYAAMFAINRLTEAGFIALVLPTFFGYLGANVTQKSIQKEVKP